jgi:hypothetical protein
VLGARRRIRLWQRHKDTMRIRHSVLFSFVEIILPDSRVCHPEDPPWKKTPCAPRIHDRSKPTFCGFRHGNVRLFPTTRRLLKKPLRCNNRIIGLVPRAPSPAAAHAAGFHLLMLSKSNPHLNTSESFICREVALVQELKCHLL